MLIIKIFIAIIVEIFIVLINNLGYSEQIKAILKIKIKYVLEKSSLKLNYKGSFIYNSNKNYKHIGIKL